MKTTTNKKFVSVNPYYKKIEDCIFKMVFDTFKVLNSIKK